MPSLSFSLLQTSLHTNETTPLLTTYDASSFKPSIYPDTKMVFPLDRSHGIHWNLNSKDGIYQNIQARVRYFKEGQKYFH